MGFVINKRSIFYAIFFLLFLYEDFSFSNQYVFSLKGHLDHETLSMIEKEINSTTEAVDLVFIINSTSGDLNALINTAQSIFQYKKIKKTQVIVYIDGNALGPSAIIPFLSDQLYTSPFAVWGDILLGSEEGMGLNLLKSHLFRLLDENKKSDLFKSLIIAMIDGNQKSIFNGSFNLIKNSDQNQNLLSGNGQTLVLNQSQIKELGLIQGFLSLNEFEKKFQFTSKENKKITQSKLENEFSKYIKINNETNSIGYLSINNKQESIGQSTWIYIKNALDHYKKTKPAFIILELNTPGGEVFAAQTISDALKEIDQEYGIPVIAYINDWAISAGAMIAYSCRFITTVENGSMGAAEPVILNQEGGMQSASEKVNSALRKDFANRAQFFGRNADIAEAMVDKDIILVYRNNKIIRLDSKDQIRLKEPNPDLIISNETKLLTLNGNEMIKYGVADAIIKRQGYTINEHEKREGKWSFAKDPLSQLPFDKKIKNLEIDAYKMDWKTSFFAFLATPLVSSLLMLGLILGFYLEVSMPGFGLPGVIALISLILIILSNLSLEIANFFEVLILFVGILLILMEIFFFPTAGILGVIGTIFFIGGLFAVILPNIGKIDFESGSQSFNAAGEEFFKRFAILSITLVIAFVIILILAYYFTPSFKLFNRFILKGGEQEASHGYSVANKDEQPKIGAKGKVFSTLRPSGKVIIDDKIYEAISEGDFIEVEEEIMVQGYEGSVIIVRK